MWKNLQILAKYDFLQIGHGFTPLLHLTFLYELLKLIVTDSFLGTLKKWAACVLSKFLYSCAVLKSTEFPIIFL